MSGKPDGAVLALERDLPRADGLVRVRRADEPEVRDRAQRRVVLDRLVRRAVLAEADRVVRPHEERLQLGQRREAHGIALVVAEDEERRAVRLQHPVVQRDAVDDRAARELADAEGDVAARVRRAEEAAALELRLRRLDEVGGAADHRRRVVLDRLHHLRARVARGQALAGLEVRQRLDPAGNRLARVHLVPALAQAGILRRPGARASAATRPRARSPRSTPFMCAATSSGTTNFSSGSQPSTSLVARTSSSPSGLPCAFAVSMACGAGYAMCEWTMTSDGFAVSACAFAIACASSSRSFTSCDVLHVPAVRLEARASSSRERDRRRAVDRDVVVVVEVDELAEAERARRSTPPRSRRPP